jgi:hypothetical protein
MRLTVRSPRREDGDVPDGTPPADTAVQRGPADLTKEEVIGYEQLDWQRDYDQLGLRPHSGGSVNSMVALNRPDAEWRGCYDPRSDCPRHSSIQREPDMAAGRRA